jgi:hypothetical protein
MVLARVCTCPEVLLIKRKQWFCNAWCPNGSIAVICFDRTARLIIPLPYTDPACLGSVTALAPLLRSRARCCWAAHPLVESGAPRKSARRQREAGAAAPIYPNRWFTGKARRAPRYTTFSRFYDGGTLSFNMHSVIYVRPSSSIMIRMGAFSHAMRWAPWEKYMIPGFCLDLPAPDLRAIMPV